MKLRHRVRAVLFTFLLAIGALLVSVTPASAATAPGCIDTYQTHHTSVTVINNCPQGAGYYLKVIWNWPNSPSGCFWLQSGQQRWVPGNAQNPFVQFKRVDLC